MSKLDFGLIRNKIDYDKACRKGIYSLRFQKDKSYSTDNIEELKNYLNKCNDEVIHLHK